MISFKKHLALSLSIVLLTLCILGTTVAYASNENTSNDIIPQKQDIEAKANYNKFKQISDTISNTNEENAVKQEKVNKYLESLDDKTLLLTIAESADELQKSKEKNKNRRFDDFHRLNG